MAVALVVVTAVPVARSFVPRMPRDNSVTMLAAFAGEERDPRWASAMETHLRDSMRPALAALDGARLLDVECRSRSCRISLAVTAELKEKLNRESPHGVGFAMEGIRRVTGPLAPRTHALFDGSERSRLERALRYLWLRSAANAARHWHLSHLDRETYILAFDDSNRELADQVRWNEKILLAWRRLGRS